jgi:hypothetical protein
MPLDSYGFSAKFGWLIDRFGVSWQLNLPQGAGLKTVTLGSRHPACNRPHRTVSGTLV